MSRTTVYAWVRDLPIERSGRQKEGQRLGNAAMQAKYRKLREEAYAEGRRTFATLAQDPLFRDFVTLYIAEGYKRDRNRGRPRQFGPGGHRGRRALVAAVVERWSLLLLAVPRRPGPVRVAGLLGSVLGIDGSAIRLQRKSNSGHLAGRRWRSQHGVLTVWAGDTLLRARLQAWIDCTRDQWLSSAPAGV